MVFWAKRLALQIGKKTWCYQITDFPKNKKIVKLESNVFQTDAYHSKEVRQVR